MRMGARELAVAVLLLGALGVATNMPAADGVKPVLYVTNSLGDDITVIDLHTLKATADIKVGDKVHGVCAPADGRQLFTTIESEKALKVLDTATNEIVATIQLTGRPNQCASTPDGRYVAVPIRDNGSIDIVDVPQRKVLKVLPIEGPHNCYNSGSNTDMYCSSMKGNEIARINLKTMEYAGKIAVGGIPRPYAVSTDQKMLYVALTDFHGFAAVDLANGNKIERVELPAATAASNCEKLEPRTPTHGLALTPDDKQLWITSLSDSGVYVYDVATKKISKEVPTGTCPNWISVSPDGKYVTVSNSASDDSSIFDAKTHRELARVKVGKGPKRLLAVNISASSGPSQ
jgi:YVTN family beta-propeller protein